MDQNPVNQNQQPQYPEPDPGDGTAVERAPETDVPEEQQVATMDAIHGAAKHADALRAHALPEGSEPAFIFRPVPTSDRSGHEQDYG